MTVAELIEALKALPEDQKGLRVMIFTGSVEDELEDIDGALKIRKDYEGNAVIQLT